MLKPTFISFDDGVVVRLSHNNAFGNYYEEARQRVLSCCKSARVLDENYNVVKVFNIIDLMDNAPC